MTTVPHGRLSPNPWNTNEMTAEDELRLENSIKELSMYRPIVVRTLDDGSYQILGGEHRWIVMGKLGYDEVPIVNLGRIPDAKAKKIGLVDNARYGHDNTLELAELLKDLGPMEDLQKIMPFSSDDLASIFAATTIATTDLDALDDDGSPGPSAKAGPTHQVMRFKVPVEDVAWVQAAFERVMKQHGYVGEDSMTNAGNALVQLVRDAKESA
jgi:ParB family chromosome partitioning protein